MKACAHLGFQFNEFDGLERIAQAAKAGFTAAEWPSIFEFDRKDFMQTVKSSGLSWAQVTLPLGNVTAGEKGITALPGRELEFASDLEKAIDYALELGSSFIHPMSGVNSSLEIAVNLETYLSNLRLAVRQANMVELKVLVEVLSQSTVPNYAMCAYGLARQVFEEVEGLYLLLDTYHAAALTGNVPQAIEDWSSWGGKIGHVQIADSPGRHEPGTGSLDFIAIQTSLKQAGYVGLLGCEYKPIADTVSGLRYLRTRGWL